MSRAKYRWDIVPKLSWSEDFAVPFGILLFLGITFCGASLLIRKMDPTPMWVKVRRGS